MQFHALESLLQNRSNLLTNDVLGEAAEHLLQFSSWYNSLPCSGYNSSDILRTGSFGGLAAWVSECHFTQHKNSSLIIPCWRACLGFFSFFFPSASPHFLTIIVVFLTRIKCRSCYFLDLPMLLCGKHWFLATFTHYKLRSSYELGKIMWYSLDSQIPPMLFEHVRELQKPGVPAFHSEEKV